MEKGVQRWIIDISKWNPSSNDFSFALSLLPQTHHSSITRFVKMEDRKRALVSLLLQYTLIHEVLGIPYPDIVINRTLEGKPFLECGRFCFDFPNFNFNVSHHGDYVAIASEPLCLVGLDIVNFMIPEKETVSEYIQNFSSYFSSSEWDRIISVGNNEEVLAEFYRYWCLKEAYVKAIGSGLAYGLHKVEFHHTNWTSISVKVDGATNQQWRFWLFDLDKGHSVSIARGHPRLAIESYKRSLKRTKFNEEEYNVGLHLPNPRLINLYFPFVCIYIYTHICLCINWLALCKVLNCPLMERNKNCFRYFKEIHSLSMKKLKHLDVRTEDELLGSVSPSSDETDSIRSHIKKMGPICKSRKKFVHVSPLSSMAEDDNFDEQILSNGSFISTADDETMWLSSGCFSPSSFFKERNGSDEWLVSWLSTMASASTDLDSSSQASEAENIEDLNGDEPIFWPFERKIDWKSEETWKHFTMSPRKDIIKVTALEETVNTDKNLQKPKQGSKDCHNGGHKIREGNTMPSRLRESTKVSAKIVPLNIENQILALKVEEDDIMGSISTCRNLWKDDFTSNGDVPIEKVVGLGEFDGHEGIDSDFNEGVFLLDEAL